MKLDLLKEYKDQYQAAKQPILLDVPSASYLSIQGQGSPESQAFADALGALYAMAYALKFQFKTTGKDYTVCKLEGVYGVDGQCASTFIELPREDWKWELVIRVPTFVTDDDLARARATLIEKKKQGPFERVGLVTLTEGPCVQMLHVGPFSQEDGTIEQMHHFAAEQGYTPNGWHREIYLSDPRRIAPEKLRTILRHPVRRVE